MQGFFAYHLFGLLWTNQVIVGFGYVVIAYAIGVYYWSRGIRAEMSKHPVRDGALPTFHSSLKRTCCLQTMLVTAGSMERRVSVVCSCAQVAALRVAWVLLSDLSHGF